LRPSTVGNAEKQGVLGVSAAMMKIYDKRCRRETIGVINGAIYGGAVSLRASRCCDGGPPGLEPGTKGL
jgi:hypothetical protein